MCTRIPRCVVVGLFLAAIALCAASAAAKDPAPATEPPSAAVNAPQQAPHGEAEQGDKAEAKLDPLVAPPEMAVWTLVVFVLLLLVLWRFAWGPIAQGLSRREQRVADQIAQAEQAHQQARELLAQYEQRLADAQAEVRQILEAGRRDAEEVGRQLVEKAKGETRQEKQRALAEIDSATSGALKELADRSATLAVELAGRILKKDLDARSHAGLIEQAVSDFARQPVAARSRGG